LKEMSVLCSLQFLKLRIQYEKTSSFGLSCSGFAVLPKTEHLWISSTLENSQSISFGISSLPPCFLPGSRCYHVLLI
jgi:hypothetical protein